MKKLSLTIFAAAALTLLLAAQVTNTIRADIPFEFVVGQTTAPAGTYIFSFQATEGMVRMQLAGTAGRFVMTSRTVLTRVHRNRSWSSIVTGISTFCPGLGPRQQAVVS